MSKIKITEKQLGLLLNEQEQENRMSPLKSHIISLLQEIKHFMDDKGETSFSDDISETLHRLGVDMESTPTEKPVDANPEVFSANEEVIEPINESVEKIKANFKRYM
jgi:hypothetical protein